jgi:hypothetical protein
MAKRKLVVRVVLPDGMNELTPELIMFLEQLRYAGLVEVHRNDADGVCFDLLCPHGLNDEVWARQNAEHMQSYTYNAVVAPRA